MELNQLTQQFGKKNIPQIKPGDTIRVYFKIREGNKTRVQIFEGICLKVKGGKSLNSSFTLRKISGGIGVERSFPLHSPLITKLEKIKSRKVRQAKLYFIRDLIGKKAKKIREEKDYKMWEEALSEEELAKVEEEKRLAAETKKQAKAKKKEELEKKFEQAIATHEQKEEVKEETKEE